MSEFELYSFVLCLVTLLLLVIFFGILIGYLVKLSLMLVRLGHYDTEIIDEMLKPRKERRYLWVDRLFSLLLLITVLIAFAFSLYVNLQESASFDTLPTMKVVASSSMSKKNPRNAYLEENGLDDQFDTFDIILTYRLPAEEDLKLYDVVVYEVDDMMIVHRIVGIEEPNQHHPEERWFTLRGDAVDQSDRFPVHYSQMRAIYRGERIPFLGSLVTFLQSPVGWLCILLVIVVTVAIPKVQKTLEHERELRFYELTGTTKDEF